MEAHGRLSETRGERMELGGIMFLGHSSFGRELREWVTAHGAQWVPVESYDDLLDRLTPDRFQVVVLDLDTTSIDDRRVRALKRKNPRLKILCLSSRAFHPELEESMGKHITACLRKPCDEEELCYWLRAVQRVPDDAEPR